MKYLFVFSLITFLILDSKGQSLTGIWEGWYLYRGNKKDTVVMKLDIRPKTDSTLEIYSFTKEGEVKSVCRMDYKLLNDNSIYLQEVELVRSNTSRKDFRLQMMWLKIARNYKTMSGSWGIRDDAAYGKIYFRKKETLD